MLGFDLAARLAKKVIVARCGEPLAKLIAMEARREYKSLIPRLPYIGGRRNPQTQILLSAALFLALYKALKVQDWAVEEIGALVHEAVDTTYARVPLSLCRLYGRLGFRESSLRKAREQAKASQERRHAGDWRQALTSPAVTSGWRNPTIPGRPRRTWFLTCTIR